jgi:hypothetical protein
MNTDQAPSALLHKIRYTMALSTPGYPAPIGPPDTLEVVEGVFSGKVLIDGIAVYLGLLAKHGDWAWSEFADALAIIERSPKFDATQMRRDMEPIFRTADLETLMAL